MKSHQRSIKNIKLRQQSLHILLNDNFWQYSFLKHFIYQLLSNYLIEMSTWHCWCCVEKYEQKWLSENYKPVTKEWLKMKMTKLWIGYFMTISCHFFTNYINNFHKTEDLRVILVCPIYKNINWIKSYDINNNFCFVSVFSIL